MTEIRDVRTAEDVTGEILQDAEAVYDGWFAEEARVDWEAFIDRLSDNYGPQGKPPYEFLDYDSPAVRKVQKYVRALRREAA